MSPAERQRTRRARRRAAMLVVRPLAVPPGAIEAMIDAGLLSAWDANDKQAVAAAIERLLATFEAVTL